MKFAMTHCLANSICSPDLVACKFEDRRGLWIFHEKPKINPSHTDIQ